MPPVDETCRKLLDLYGQLERVLREEDWMGLGEVDRAIRDQLLLMARQPGLSEEAAKARQRLKKLHSEAYTACAAECERLRQVLLSHMENGQGRMAYQQVGGD